MTPFDLWLKTTSGRRLLSHSLDSAPVGVVLLDQEGRFGYLNPCFLGMVGGDVTSFLGKSVRELDVPLFPPGTQELLATRVDRRVQTGEAISDEEVELLGTDGEPFPVVYSASGIRDEHGRVIGEVVFISDNTERKRARQQVRELQVFQRALIDNTDVWLNVLDPQGKVILWNQTAQRLSGYHADEVLGGDRIWDWLYPDPAYRAGILERLKHQALTTKVLRNWETIIRTRDGEERAIAWTLRGLKLPDGTSRGTLVVGQDMTELRQLQSSLAHADRLASLGTLAGGVAHEVNNPIAIALYNAELALDELPPGSPVADYLRDIQGACERIATVVRNLLSFARADSQAPGPAVIGDLVQRTTSLIRRLFDRDCIEVRVDVQEGLPQVACNPDQVQQVLMNLLTNARDSLNARYGGGHPDKVITIRSFLFEESDVVWLRTTVEDRGVGISARMGGRIFDPFITSKPQGEGTGLGLSVSHGIIAEHDGRLLAESEVGRYARFHMDLPVGDPTDSSSDVFLPDGDSLFGNALSD